jgi:ATP-binding cassette subfamily F protein uup
MHYVSAEGLTKSFGIKPLFDNISFHISEGDKIALVARNGAGKSTLLKIVAGLETPDEGKLWLNKEVDVAYFEQDPHLIDNLSVLDNIFHHAHPVINLIKKYEAAVEAEDEKKINSYLGEMDA